jgi:hypothetical protein
MTLKFNVPQKNLHNTAIHIHALNFPLANTDLWIYDLRLWITLRQPWTSHQTSRSHPCDPPWIRVAFRNHRTYTLHWLLRGNTIDYTAVSGPHCCCSNMVLVVRELRSLKSVTWTPTVPYPLKTITNLEIVIHITSQLNTLIRNYT